MKTLIRVLFVLLMIFPMLSANPWAAPVHIQNSSRVLGPSTRLALFDNGMVLGAGQYDIDIAVNGKVWQKGRDSFGWEPSDRIIIQATLDGVPLVDVVQSGLSGQDRPFSKTLSLDFTLSSQARLQVNIIADASSHRERVKILNVDANGMPFAPSSVPIPLPGGLYLLASGLIGLAVWRKARK